MSEGRPSFMAEMVVRSSTDLMKPSSFIVIVRFSPESKEGVSEVFDETAVGMMVICEK